MNSFNFSGDWAESKKNCLTFLIGGNLHLILFLIVQYLSKNTGNMLAELFYRFYSVFVLIDMFTMAILYKCYWGRSIINEMENDGRWHFDKENHKYSLRQDHDRNVLSEHINEFFDRGVQLDN